MTKIKIVEVGLRDGLQNESVFLSVDQRIEILKDLASSGLKYLEVGAFVRPDKVPQMAGSQQVLEAANKLRAKGIISKATQFSVLVPNALGFSQAQELNPNEIAVFASCSESFSQSNINCSIDESFERFVPVVEHARKRKIRVRGYLSVCFGCPFEGKVSEKKVVQLVQRMLKLKVDEISIGDTIGVANVDQVESLIGKIKKVTKLSKIAVHFHDTRGQALANILAAYRKGIRTFDTSLGGLGGCPYAPGSTGNVATEDVVYMFDGMKISSGVDLSKLIEINHKVSNWMGKKLPSKVSRAGLLKTV